MLQDQSQGNLEEAIKFNTLPLSDCYCNVARVYIEMKDTPRPEHHRGMWLTTNDLVLNYSTELLIQCDVCQFNRLFFPIKKVTVCKRAVDVSNCENTK